MTDLSESMLLPQSLRSEDAAFYRRLYDFACAKAEAVGCELVLPKAAFCCAASNHPNGVYYRNLKDMDTMDYIFSMYWLFYNRVPDAAALAYWCKIADRKSPEKMKKRMCRRLSASLEASVKGVVFVHGDRDPAHYASFDLSGFSEKNPVKRVLYFFRRRMDQVLRFMYRVYCVTLRPLKIKLMDRSRNRGGM